MPPKKRTKKGRKAAKRANVEAKQVRRRNNQVRKKERGKRDKEWECEMVKFEAQLAKANLIVREIKGDGNCLFRAVSDQLTGYQTDHKVYRDECVKEYKNNAEGYEPFLVDETLEEYREKISQDGEWGGNLELIALSRRLCIDIIVHQYNRPRFEIHYEGSPVQTIHISYHEGDHYNSIRRSDDDEQSPAAPITATLTLRDLSNKKEVEIVSQQTGCKNSTYISECLTMFGGDLDSTVGYMMEDVASWPVAEETNVEMKSPVKPRKFNRKGPCPCGSGRKFKKCCAQSKTSSSKKNEVKSTKKLSNKERKRLLKEKKGKKKGNKALAKEEDTNDDKIEYGEPLRGIAI